MTPHELRVVLTDLGVRQGVFAKRLGVSRGAVCKWLDGSRGIPEHAVRLARQAAARGYWTRSRKSKRGADLGRGPMHDRKPTYCDMGHDCGQWTPDAARKEFGADKVEYDPDTDTITVPCRHGYA